MGKTYTYDERRKFVLKSQRRGSAAYSSLQEADEDESTRGVRRGPITLPKLKFMEEGK